MNAPAFHLIESDLEEILNVLVSSFGGHGNGVAALWPDGKTRIAKSIFYDEVHAATLLRRYLKQGATWFVFHTRRASIGEILSRNCHPFQLNHGNFVLAHNGHDPQFAQWGRLLGITDSACIARTWSKLQLPLGALKDVRGVFVGFHNGAPFVVKGSLATDLMVLWQHNGDAVFFASELPDSLQYDGTFDHVASVGRFIATNEEEISQILSHPRPCSLASYGSAFATYHAPFQAYGELLGLSLGKDLQPMQTLSLLDSQEEEEDDDFQALSAPQKKPPFLW
jgi:hypothetical protein